jgi:hypothetical protein
MYAAVTARSSPARSPCRRRSSCDVRYSPVIPFASPRLS